MKLLCTAGITVVNFFLFFSVNAQQTFLAKELPFLQHLDRNNLAKEKLYYLKTLRGSVFPETQDSINLYETLVFHNLSLSDSALTFFEKINATSQLKYTYQTCLNIDLLKKEKYTEIINQKGLSQKFKKELWMFQYQSALILNRSLSPNDTVTTLLKPYAERFWGMRNLSPFKAGLYSAVLPGAGKWYVGKRTEAITVFIANALLAAQSIESYNRSGPQSFRFIFSAGLFSVFYSGNIWGSVLSARKKSIEDFKQLQNEILEYNYTLCRDCAQ